jgi:undecaprenyl-diphosphatase
MKDGHTIRFTIFRRILTVWPEVRLLLYLLVPASLMFAFIKVAGEVIEGDTIAFDRAVLLALRSAVDTADPIGPAWVEATMRDLTALGSTIVLTIVTLAMAGLLFMTGHRRLAMLLLFAVSLGTVVSNALKFFLARPRPDFVAHAVDVHTMSFPSGHTMLSAVTYLTIGALLARDQPFPIKAYILFVSIFLSMLVGLSRVYLGVHYPTDVLAGWAIGGAWACLWWIIAVKLPPNPHSK